MSLFSDRCENCGVAVKKRAKFCSKCGTPAPGSWIKCHNCNKWIGAESEFCHRCKAPQHVLDRESIEEGVIRRSRGIFLQRFDLNKIKSRLGKEWKIVIEPGNVALLMVEGKIVETLPSGSYGLKEGVFRNIQKNYKCSIFLIDSEEIIFPYSQTEIKSREDLDLNLYTEIIYRLNVDSASSLITNLLKTNNILCHKNDFTALKESENNDIQNTSARQAVDNKSYQLGYSEFWKYLNSDIYNSVIKLCADLSIDALIRDPDIRFTFEEALAKEISSKARSSSMNLVRVAAVNFYGAKYEKLREMAGDLEVKTREAVLEKRAYTMLVKTKKEKVSSEHELNIYLDQLAYEYDLDKESKQFDLDSLKLDLAQKLDLRIFEHEQTIRKKKHEDELDETLDWIHIRELKDALKLTSEKERMEIYSKYSVKELAAVLLPAQIEMIIKARNSESTAKLEEKLLSLSPEQILAMKSDKSPEAAKAVADIAKAKNYKDILAAETKAEMSEKGNKQMERIFDKSIEANAKVAGSLNSKRNK